MPPIEQTHRKPEGGRLVLKRGEVDLLGLSKAGKSGEWIWRDKWRPARTTSYPDSVFKDHLKSRNELVSYRSKGHNFLHFHKLTKPIMYNL